MSQEQKAVKKASFKSEIASWNGWAHYLTWLYIMLYVLIFPIILDQSKYLKLTGGKFNFFFYSTVIYLVLMGFRRLTALITGEQGLVSPKYIWQNSSLTQKAMVAYIFIAIISAILSEYSNFVWMGASRFDGLLTLILYFFVFMCISMFGRIDRWHVLGMGLSMLIFSVIGLLQCWNIDIMNLYPSGKNFYNSNFVAMAGNIDMASGILCICISLMSAAFVVIKDKWRWLLLPSVVASVMLISLINVDSGIVGLAISMIIMMPLLFRSRERILNGLILLITICITLAVAKSIVFSQTTDTLGKLVVNSSFALSGLAKMLICGAVTLILIWLTLFLFKEKFRPNPKFMTIGLATVLFVAVAVGGICVYHFADDPSKGFIYEVGQIMHGNFNDEFGSGRIMVWKRALLMATQHPIIGTGPGSFYAAFTLQFQDEIEALGANVTFDFAHNDYIQILCNMGILGLLAYVTGLIGQGVAFFKNVFRDEWVAILGAPVLCYCVHIFFSFSIVIVAPLFFVLFGLLDKRNGDLRKCIGKK
ncbi:MAG: O-antigen ligase family protein [Clostridia bacterium]